MYREVNRGTTEQSGINLIKYTRYFYDVGQRIYEENKANRRSDFKFVKAYEFIKYTEKEILESKLSPYVIRGNEKLVNNFKCAVCAKTLYNYIGKGLLKVKNIDLLLRIRRKTKGGM